jgi:hypothetical protein
MPVETYKGFEICEMWNKETPYYIVCKEFKEDPFWEIGSIEYDTISKAKKEIDQGVYS